MFLPTCSKNLEDAWELSAISVALENSHLHVLGVLEIESVIKSRNFSSHPLAAKETDFVSVMN